MIHAAKWSELAAHFEAREVRFKPGKVNGNRALAIPYVDARAVMDRLDEVLGVAGWQDEYQVLPDGAVVCTLRCRAGLEGEWITKSDVGGQSEQPDEGDRRKAAFSDALKRAAVKFGIGRYLYRLPTVWCDYDPHKRQFLKPPQLPSAARPKPPPAPPAADPAEIISDDQARELSRLIVDTGADPGKFCTHFGIPEAQSLPAALFGAAVTLLHEVQEKREKKAKAHASN